MYIFEIIKKYIKENKKIDIKYQNKIVFIS